MMKKTVVLPAALALASLLLLQPQPADAGVSVDVHIGLPVAPVLVVVQPGVQVVEDFDEEVYFTGGHYWVRRDGAWYRSSAPRAAFVMVETSVVPATIVKLPPGQYVRYNKGKHGKGNGKGHGGGKHKH